MPTSLLLATTNPGKVREVRRYLADLPGLSLTSLNEFPSPPEIPEEGETFRDNAVAKAVGYSRSHRGLTLADDSGLCVEALGGEPGVHSARFGGAGLDDRGRCEHLLARMEGLPEERRSARFECVLALAAAGRLIGTFTGTVEGRILFEPRGSNGFGYDPLFWYEPEGRTFAELSPRQKAAVSHRGCALAELKRYLQAHPEIP